MSRGLTDKQAAWARAYIGPAKFNASEAARMVGIKPEYGREMRSKSHVMDYVEKLQVEAAERWQISQARTLEELCAVAFSNVTEIVTFEDGRLIVRDLDELPRTVTAAIKEIKLRRVKVHGGEPNEFEEVFEIKFHDKLAALEKIGQYQGLFKGQGGEETEEWTGLEVIKPQLEGS